MNAQSDFCLHVLGDPAGGFEHLNHQVAQQPPHGQVNGLHALEDVKDYPLDRLCLFKEAHRGPLSFRFEKVLQALVQGAKYINIACDNQMRITQAKATTFSIDNHSDHNVIVEGLGGQLAPGICDAVFCTATEYIS